MDDWKKVESMLGPLCEKMDLVVVPHIQCLRPTDRECIYARNNTMGRFEAVAELLSILGRKDKKRNYKDFMDALKETGQSYLMEQIDPDYNKPGETLENTCLGQPHTRYSIDHNDNLLKKRQNEVENPAEVIPSQLPCQRRELRVDNKELSMSPQNTELKQPISGFQAGIPRNQNPIQSRNIDESSPESNTNNDKQNGCSPYIHKKELKIQNNVEANKKLNFSEDGVMKNQNVEITSLIENAASNSESDNDKSTNITFNISSDKFTLNSNVQVGDKNDVQIVSDNVKNEFETEEEIVYARGNTNASNITRDEIINEDQSIYDRSGFDGESNMNRKSDIQNVQENEDIGVKPNNVSLRYRSNINFMQQSNELEQVKGKKLEGLENVKKLGEEETVRYKLDSLESSLQEDTERYKLKTESTQPSKSINNTVSSEFDFESEQSCQLKDIKSSRSDELKSDKETCSYLNEKTVNVKDISWEKALIPINDFEDGVSQDPQTKDVIKKQRNSNVSFMMSGLNLMTPSDEEIQRKTKINQVKNVMPSKASTLKTDSFGSEVELPQSLSNINDFDSAYTNHEMATSEIIDDIQHRCNDEDSGNGSESINQATSFWNMFKSSAKDMFYNFG